MSDIFDKWNGLVRLKSGRVLYANNCVIGISEDSEGMGILYTSGGYDNGLIVFPENESADDVLTPEERRQLADMVIAMWNKWAEQAPGKG